MNPTSITALQTFFFMIKQCIGNDKKCREIRFCLALTAKRAANAICVIVIRLLIPEMGQCTHTNERLFADPYPLPGDSNVDFKAFEVVTGSFRT
jgi:hypothetical protein